MYRKTEKKKSVCRRDTDEIPFERRKNFQTDYGNSSSSTVAAHPPHRSAVGLPKFETVNQLVPAGHADDAQNSVDECEEVAGHSSVDNSSDGDSVMCSICLDTITAQQVGTPDVCDHTFCLACLQEWARNKNTPICPLDRQKFNFILVRHHLKGEIIEKIPLELDRRVRYSELSNFLFPLHVSATLARLYALRL
jgi:hypothetical protein